MLAMFSQGVVIVVVVLGALAVLIVALAWQAKRAERTESWPETEATIQSVGAVVVNAGRSSYTLEVGDFSYSVNGEYYSGRLTISSSFSTDDRAPRVLIHQKIQLRYNPEKPEEFSVSEQALEGFVLSPYNAGSFASDVDPIDLNIDKV